MADIASAKVVSVMGMLLVPVILTPGCTMISAEAPTDVYGDQNRLKAGAYYLRKDLLKVVVTRDGNKTSVKIDPQPVADKRQLIQSGIHTSILSHDHVVITYNSDGLIATIRSNPQDKTSEIITTLVKSVSGFRTTPNQPKVSEKAKEYTFIYDPFDASENALVRRQMLSAGLNICIEVEYDKTNWFSTCKKSDAYNAQSDVADPIQVQSFFPSKPGIYYRTARSHRANVYVNGIFDASTILQLATAGNLLSIDINRTVFATQKTDVDFTNGIPTSFTVDKGSEALAVAALPLSITTAVTQGIIDSISRHRDVQNAEAELLKAEANRIKQQNEVDSLLKSSLPINEAKRTAILQAVRRSTLGPAGASGFRIGLVTPQQCEATYHQGHFTIYDYEYCLAIASQ